MGHPTNLETGSAQVWWRLFRYCAFVLSTRLHQSFHDLKRCMEDRTSHRVFHELILWAKAEVKSARGKEVNPGEAVARWSGSLTVLWANQLQHLLASA